MKKISHEAKQTLASSVNFYLSEIAKLDQNLGTYVKKLKDHEPSRILSAYYLSGIYSCVEDIFEKIAKTYENSIENPAAWHSELLLRMKMPIKGVRRQVIRDDVYMMLDEMGSFRHVFRESYVFSLDGERIERLVRRWKNQKKAFLEDLNAFLKRI